MPPCFRAGHNGIMYDKGSVSPPYTALADDTDPPYYAYVYNLEVEDYHTYYVGRDGILVHNADYFEPHPKKGMVGNYTKCRSLYVA